MIYHIPYQSQIVSLATNNTHIAKSYRLGKFYEQPLLQELLNYTGTLVDIGAHIGNHSIFLSAFGSYNLITAIEACPEHYQMLLQNIDSNKELCQNIAAYNLAATDSIKRYGISRTGPNDGAYSLCPGTEVQGVPLDMLLTKVDVMKLDVEGHELEVLNGCHRLLKYKPILFIELNHNVEEIKQFLRDYDYTLDTVFRMGSPVGKFICQSKSER